MFQLHKTLHRFNKVDVSVAIDLFDKTITPILNYGSEVWGFHPAPDIERVHLGYLKRVMGVKKSTQNDFVYGLLGRYPMQINRNCNIIKYWLKIVTGVKSSCLLVNCLYASSLLKTGTPCVYNWAYKVKQLLCSTGFGDIWFDQGSADPFGFMHCFKERLIDMFNQGWNARLYESPRARFYRDVIKQNRFHRQLNMITSKPHRQAFARLIASSHRLRVETGRWERPVLPYEYRLCNNCNKLDDEYHFLLECTLHNDIRHQYIPHFFTERPSIFKCVALLNSNKRTVIVRLAKYIYEGFRHLS